MSRATTRAVSPLDAVPPPQVGKSIARKPWLTLARSILAILVGELPGKQTRSDRLQLLSLSISAVK